MTRKPRSRLPPKLPDHTSERAEQSPKPPNLRELLKQEHVAGPEHALRARRDRRHDASARDGAPATRLGLPPFDALENRHVEIAVAEIFGWAGDGPRARIAPARTVDGFTAACERILEVAAARGRIAFATARPASLLPLYRRLVARAGAAGADVLAADETGVVGLSGRRVRWIDGSRCSPTAPPSSATTASTPPTSGSSPSPVPTSSCPTAPSPGVAVATGLEVVAFADLDAVALAVAAWQGRSLRIVPLDDRRPPRAYAGLLDLLESLAAGPEGPARPAARFRRRPARSPSFATRAAGAYAHPAEKRGRRKG